MQLQRANNRLWYSGAICSGILLALTVVAMLCPIVPDGASAAEGEESTPVAQADNVSEPSISMALSSRTELDVTPTASGAFQASTARLQVAVTVPENYEDTGYTVSGYKIYMNAANGNTLKGSNGNNSTIEPVSANTTKANFPNNKWGYNLSSSGTAITNSTIFQPVPTTSAIIEDTDKLANTYDLTFATKVNMNIPSDQYNNSVLVSVVAEPELLTIDNITYMQQMTPGICNTMIEDQQYQLIDSRDNQKYYISRLKDGNCWMTQNLALDITTAGLKASDTDIRADWNSSSTYKPKDTRTALSSSTDPNDTESWHLNNYYYYQWVTATAGTGGGMNNNSSNKNAPGSICPKNWKLPVLDADSTHPGSYQKLLDAYSITSSNVSSITKPPLNMTMSGGVIADGLPSKPNVPVISGSGNEYSSWSATVSSATSAYYTWFQLDPAYISMYSHYRKRGRTVRCYAPGTI